MLKKFVQKLLKGSYSNKSNGKYCEFASEQGDLVRIILTHDVLITNPEKKVNGKLDDIPHEHGDLMPRAVELDRLNLPTLFGESVDFTNIAYDSDDFKYSDIFGENGEVYADTLWSSPDLGDMLVRDEHGCLISVFDVYTVSIIPSPYGLLTAMSVPPSHHRGAQPKDTVSAPRVRYACVACEFEDFKTAHSLRRHMIQIHNIACDTLVKGRTFAHVGHIMRKPNEREKYQFPRTVFPDDWAVSVIRTCADQ